MLNTFTLKNGIKVATYNLPSLKSIHLEAIVKAGAVFETPKNNGAAHFMEHMIVQGTPTLPNVEEFSNFIESLAGTYGAHTETWLVNFNITLPNTHTETAVKLASEVLFEPLFVEEAIEKERIAVINELNQRSDEIWYKMSKFMRNSRYQKNHPLQLDVGGDLEVVKKITREELMQYWKDHFLTDNTYVLVVGSFDETELKNHLETYFEKHTTKTPFAGFPKMSNDDFSARGIFIREDATLSTCYLDVSFPSLALKYPKELTLKQSLALVILGRLRNSRLFKLLRYQKGLVYGVSASPNLTPDLGAVYISSETTPEKLDEVLTLIASEVSRYVSEGPTQEELDFAKNFLTNQWLMAFDHPSSISGWIESDFIWRDKIGLPEDYAAMIAEFNVTDLKEMMQKYWDFSKLNLVLQGPIADTKENQEKFAKILEPLK